MCLPVRPDNITLGRNLKPHQSDLRLQVRGSDFRGNASRRKAPAAFSLGGHIFIAIFVTTGIQLHYEGKLERSSVVLDDWTMAKVQAQR
jgi:hypothetical protein